MKGDIPKPIKISWYILAMFWIVLGIIVIGGELTK